MSGFRSLLEMSDKIAREELGDYYIMGASRMRNMLDCLESGAKQIKELTAQRDALQAQCDAYVDALDEMVYNGPYDEAEMRDIALKALPEGRQP